MAIVYLADTKWRRLPMEARWRVRIIKAVAGLALVLIVKSVLRAPLDTLFGRHMAARRVRYFLVVVAA